MLNIQAVTSIQCSNRLWWKKFKGDSNSLVRGSECQPPTRIISVQTRRNRSSDRFNLAHSTLSQPGAISAIAWARKEEARKSASPGFLLSNCRSHSFLSRTTEQMHRLCIREAAPGEPGGSRVSWGYFQSIIRPSRRVNAVIVSSDK